MVLTFGRNKPQMYDRVPAFSPSAAQLSAYAGIYRPEEMDIQYRLAVDNGTLVLSSLKSRMPLRAVTRDVFDSELGNLSFTRGAHGRISGFSLNGARIKNFVFVRLKDAL